MALSRDDLIFLTFLVLGILFGPFYRKIRDIETEKAIGALLGLEMVVLISGWHAAHILLGFSVSCSKKLKC